ncbi:MAG: FtsQ-type POTRA domain-containing protein [Erysipelotrichaceae bacterium]|nr:FtsQ-type POTRA domain-containing protein [Erysipelotrichaceae bacterium]
MVINQDEILNDLQPQNHGVNEVFKRHNQKLYEENFNKYKKLIFRLSIFLGIFFILGSYFLFDRSKVNVVVVEGTDFLTKDYIINLSEVSDKSIYYFTIPFLVENKINKSEMVDSVKVSYQQNNVIKISVNEIAPVGYRYVDAAEILLSNGSIIPLKSDYMSFLSRVPLITGFFEEESEYLLIKSLSKVDQEMIENISEIKQYNFDYDPYTLEIFMRDGNYFFASFYSLELINSYNLIASKLITTNNCIFADEGLKVAYKKKCPWDEVKSQLEYWKNDNGEFILNKYGDKVVIHYLKDEFDNYVLDENGNKIPIPVNEYGEEIGVLDKEETQEVIEELPIEGELLPE